MKHSQNFEDLEKVPLEGIILALQKEIKQLKFEAGQREVYISELEEVSKQKLPTLGQLEDRDRQIFNLKQRLEKAQEQVVIANRRAYAIQKQLLKQHESTTKY